MGVAGNATTCVALELVVCRPVAGHRARLAIINSTRRMLNASQDTRATRGREVLESLVEMTQADGKPLPPPQLLADQAVSRADRRPA